jgi:hypothetical protein
MPDKFKKRLDEKEEIEDLCLCLEHFYLLITLKSLLEY